MELFQHWDPDQTLSRLLALTAAYLLALPIGWNRERADRSAGLRTFPLVAISACGFVIISIEGMGADPTAQSRVLAGLMTGIGFIGGGAILKQGERAKGTATAASIWATGAIGAAVGYGHFDTAVILSLATFLSLSLSPPLIKAVREKGPPDPDDI